MPLTQWESDSFFVSLYVATGMIHGADAQSLLLVGNPGEGKSELLRRFSGVRSATLVSDITVDGLRELVDQEGRTSPLRHIILPEFGRIFAHRQDTTSALTGLLTSLMTRDAGAEMVGPRHSVRYDFSGQQIGVLAAMPTDTYRFYAKAMQATGFLDRFTVLGIKRSAEERARVLHNIYHGDRRDLLPFKMNLPTEPAVIRGVETYGPMVGEWLREWQPHARERMAIHLLGLLPAVTLLRGRREVRASDVEVLRLFQSYFQTLSFDGTGRIRSIEPIPTWDEFQEQQGSEGEND